VPFTADTTIGTLMARLDRPLAVPEELGALAPVIERAGAMAPADRPDAAALAQELVTAATQLPRPAPLALAGTRAADGSTNGVESDSDRTILHGRPNGAPGEGSDAAHDATTVQRVSTTTALAQIPDSTERMGRPQHPSNPGQAAQLPPAPKLAPTARAARLRTWTIRIAAAVIAVALGVAGALFFQQSRVPSHPVPQGLVGLQKAEAADRVGRFAWHVEFVEEHRDGTEAGVVVDTRPKSGENLREGGTLELIVSLGPTPVDLPPANTIAGLSEDEVTQVLGASGLELVPEFVPTESDDVDEGKVIGYDDGTPAQMPKGSTVKVQVSSGRPGPEIPDMEGWDYGDARDELERLGLNVEVSTEENDDFDTGKVIRSDPEFGDHAEDGGTVTLVLSQGDGPIQVPNLDGRKVGRAKHELEALGLEVGEIRGTNTGDDATVFATTPFAGQEVDPGTKVDLWSW
jgi:serine/threonine-protein kinase